jgi:hypothetical protein
MFKGKLIALNDYGERERKKERERERANLIRICTEAVE